jgi:hypothetical protein
MACTAFLPQLDVATTWIEDIRVPTHGLDEVAPPGSRDF